MTDFSHQSRTGHPSKVDKSRKRFSTCGPKDPTKLERVLTYLATGRSLHRFEAEREVNDHCLPSTMSAIKHELNIPYRTKTDTVPGWHGHPTRVSRYWLDTEAQIKAWERVHTMRKRRGASSQAEALEAVKPPLIRSGQKLGD